MTAARVLVALGIAVAAGIPSRAESLTLIGTHWEVTLAPERAFTIYDLAYDGIPLMNHNSCQGTILLVRSPDGDGAYIGSCHEYETVLSASLTVDEQPAPSLAGRYTGQRFVFTRQTVLEYPGNEFSLLATLILDDTAITESITLTVTSATATIEDLVISASGYDHSLSYYCIAYPDGTVLAGRTNSGSGALQYFPAGPGSVTQASPDFRVSTTCSPQSTLYEPVPMIWNRADDNKLNWYLVRDLVTVPQGTTWQCSVVRTAAHHHMLLPGDANGDRAVNYADIGPFVLALTNPAAYRDRYPGGTPDCNGDGVVTYADINLFVANLSNLPWNCED